MKNIIINKCVYCNQEIKSTKRKDTEHRSARIVCKLCASSKLDINA